MWRERGLTNIAPRSIVCGVLGEDCNEAASRFELSEVTIRGAPIAERTSGAARRRRTMAQLGRAVARSAGSCSGAARPGSSGGDEGQTPDGWLLRS